MAARQLQQEDEEYDNCLIEFFGQLLTMRRHVCTIMLSVGRGNISEKSSLLRREHYLNMVRSHSGGDKCCERCGIVEWIENEG